MSTSVKIAPAARERVHLAETDREDRGHGHIEGV